MENKNKATQGEKQPHSAGSVRHVVKYAVALLLFLLVTNPALLPFLSQSTRESIGNVWGSLFGDVSSIVGILSINWATLFKLVAMALLVKLVVSVIRMVLEKLRPATGRGRSALSMARSALSYVAVLGAVLWGLSILGVSVSTIFAGVGVMALIIGFGAESLVADIVTGVFLVFEEQFNVGDIIEVGSFRGIVESIGIRTTAIRDSGGNVKIVNNSDIRNVLNRSRTSSLTSILVGISYEEDLLRVEKELGSVLPAIREKYPDTFLSDPCYAGVDALGESSIELKITAEVAEEKIFSAPRLLNREIKLAFDRAGIEIPYRQVVVHKAD